MDDGGGGGAEDRVDRSRPSFEYICESIGFFLLELELVLFGRVPLFADRER